MNRIAQAPLDRIIPVLENEWSRFQVKRAWLFGSRAINPNKTESDWDFLVEFYQPPDFDGFMGLKSALEERLAGPVDLLSRTACTLNS